MATDIEKKKPHWRMTFMGILSIGLYALLLLKQDTVNELFGRGSLYAILPIVTAFIFSFVHGSFTGNFWTAMGIEAAKKKKEVK